MRKGEMLDVTRDRLLRTLWWITVISGCTIAAVLSIL